VTNDGAKEFGSREWVDEELREDGIRNTWGRRMIWAL
jgi:hypothetical protein